MSFSFLQILFEDKKAVGVEYYEEGHHHEVYADKEVILSAGAVNSPKILMLSGVGPKQHLQDTGVSFLIILP